MPSQLGADDLILSCLTIRTDDFEERVRAAAGAGFAGIGLRHSHYAAARAVGASDADLRALLAHHGVSVAELEVLWDWGRGGEHGARSREAEERLYSVAEALGGRHLAVAAIELEDPLEVVAERFAGVCERAALRGLLVGLEFLPWTAVADAGAAWEIVRLAGAANGGVLVDSWHFYRGSADEAQLLSIPGERVIAVHLDDADAEVVGDLLDDTLHRRRLPGEGVFPLARFVQLLDGMGVRVPYSVEVISDELAALSAWEAAHRAGRAARAVLAAARGGLTTGTSDDRAERLETRPAACCPPGGSAVLDRAGGGGVQGAPLPTAVDSTYPVAK